MEKELAETILGQFSEVAILLSLLLKNDENSSESKAIRF